MESYKREFIEFMVDSQVLKFGEFTLKSGRKSPFFMNAGSYGNSFRHGHIAVRLEQRIRRAFHEAKFI